MTGPTPPEWGETTPGPAQPGGPGQPPPYGQPQSAPPPYGQPQSAPPPYGQPPYGQQPMGPVTTQFARIDPGPSQGFGLIGVTIAAVGAVLLIVAFTVTNWYDFSGGHSHFGDVHKSVTALDNLDSANSLAVIYFGWLAWALLVAGVVAAVAANLPSPLSGLLRAVGAVIGVAGIALTVLGIKLAKHAVNSASGSLDSYSDYLKHASVGFWLAIAGFVVIAIGSLIGPRRNP